MKNKAIVLLSGGQDSVTCLALACHERDKGRFDEVHALCVDYGQRHIVEIEAAHRVAKHYGVTVHTASIDMDELSASALVREGLLPDASVGDTHPLLPGLPASFVPNRNTLLLTLAHALAIGIGATTIYGGMCETDYSGYPDCREVYVQSLIGLLNSQYPELPPVELRTPLMYLDKARTFALAASIGALTTVIHESRTCYNGVITPLPGGGGVGCGWCPACELRMKGWSKYVSSTL